MTDCFCDRCGGGGPPCYVTNDHNYKGAQCTECGKTSGAMLLLIQYEKAEKEGRCHGDHFHRTLENKAKCGVLFKDQTLDEETKQELAEAYP